MEFIKRFLANIGLYTPTCDNRNPILNSPKDITRKLIMDIVNNNIDSLTINYEFTRKRLDKEKDSSWEKELYRTNPFWKANRKKELKRIEFEIILGKKVRSLAAAFMNMKSLEYVNLKDTSNVTDMSYMFSFAESFNQPIENWDTSNVTDMSDMFGYCTALTTLDLTYFDTSNVTTMNGMFAMAAIQSLPAYDTSKVIDAEAMCYMCNGLTSIPLLNTSSMTTVDAMFYNCINVESGALTLYNVMSTNPVIQSHLNTFYNCGSSTTTGAVELDQIPSDWK